MTATITLQPIIVGTALGRAAAGRSTWSGPADRRTDLDSPMHTYTPGRPHRSQALNIAAHISSRKPDPMRQKSARAELGIRTRGTASASTPFDWRPSAPFHRTSGRSMPSPSYMREYAAHSPFLRTICINSPSGRPALSAASVSEGDLHRQCLGLQGRLAHSEGALSLLKSRAPLFLCR